MGITRHRHIIRLLTGAAFLFLMTAPSRISAQVYDTVFSTEADSLAALGLEVPDSLYMGFNALHFSMQKRYRPENEDCDVSEWRHAILAFDMQGDYVNTGKSYYSSWIRGAAFSVGHRFHYNHSWRIRMSFGQLYRNSDFRSFYKLGAGFEHNFYLLSYLNGFKVRRPFEIYTIAGLGSDFYVNSSRLDGTIEAGGGMTLAPYVSFGVGLQFKLSPIVNFQLSPRLTVYPVQLAMADEPATELYGGQSAVPLGCSAGIQVNLGRRRGTGAGSSLQSPDHDPAEASPSRRPWFISAQAGAQFQNGDAMWSTTDYISSLRENVVLSAGSWIVPSIGVRGAFFHGANTFRRYSESVGEGVTLNRICQYNGFRAEVMLDVWGFSKKYGTHSDIAFSIPFIAGLEAGMINKKAYSGDKTDTFIGFSCGIQPRVRVSDRVTILLEPHCSILPYATNDVTEGKIRGYGTNYWDAVVSLTLGVEIALGI